MPIGIYIHLILEQQSNTKHYNIKYDIPFRVSFSVCVCVLGGTGEPCDIPLNGPVSPSPHQKNIIYSSQGYSQFFNDAR